MLGRATQRSAFSQEDDTGNRFPLSAVRGVTIEILTTSVCLTLICSCISQQRVDLSIDAWTSPMVDGLAIAPKMRDIPLGPTVILLLRSRPHHYKTEAIRDSR